MGEPEAGKRSIRSFLAAGEEHRAFEAWRSPSGHTLVLFEPDRVRAALAPTRRLEELDEEDLRSLLALAAPLTLTESVLEAPDGRFWLAQDSGPVWAAEGRGAAGRLGVVLTSLTGPFERRRKDLESPVGGGEASRLAALLELTGAS